MNRTLILAALLCLSAAGRSPADTVYFGDADRGPSNSLDFGGLQVSENVATGIGVGLGCADFGSATTLDCWLHYSPGERYPDGGFLEWADIKISGGAMNSITVIPCLPINMDTGEVLPVSFSITTSWGIPGGQYDSDFTDATNPKPITFLAPSGATGCLTSPYYSPVGQWLFFDAYRMAHLDGELNIQASCSIVSVDFTPIPEPATGALIFAGLAAFSSRLTNPRKHHTT
ncbi:MAG: hypothetical protein U1F98_13310 [Verrucomicrobiota bacterium]